jgi:hypothetical protein
MGLASIKERKQLLKNDQQEISKLLKQAEKEWMVLSSALDDSKNGLSISSEVIEGFLNQCQLTLVHNDTVEQEALKMLSQSKELSEKCLETLETLTEATNETREKAEQLVNIVKHNLLPSQIGSTVRLRNDAINIVISCKKILSTKRTLQSSSTSTTSSSSSDSQRQEELRQMKELKNSIFRINDLILKDSLEEKLVHSVKDEFLFVQWQEEVRDIFQSMIHSSSHHARNLIEEAESIGASALESNEYHILQSAIAASASLTQEASNLRCNFIQLFNEQLFPDDTLETILKTNETMNIDSEEPSHLVRPLSYEKTIYKMMDVYVAWVEKATNVYNTAKKLSEDLSTLKIVEEEAEEKVKEVSIYFDSLIECFGIIQDIHRGLQSQSQSIELLLLLLPLVDARSVTESLNRLQIFNTENFHFSYLLQYLRMALSIIQEEINIFTETHRNLVPLFVTRNRARSDAKLLPKAALWEALQQPVGRTIKTILHPRLIQVWNDILDLRKKMINFFLIFNDTAKSTNTFHESLRSDIVTIDSFIIEAELIPLELPELGVLRWASEVLNWIERIPRPYKNSKKENDTEILVLDFEEALECLDFATPLVREIPSSTMSCLIDIGLMIVDENQIPIGFAENAYHEIRLIGDYFSFLESQIEIAKLFQQKIEKVLSSSEHTLKDVENLMIEKDHLTVLPSRKSVRELERAAELEKKKKVPTAIITSTSKQQKSSSSTVTTAPSAAVVMKEKKSSKRCAALACGNHLKLPLKSGFCSDSCLVRSIETLTAAVISYKINVHSQKQAAAVGAEVLGLKISQAVMPADIKAFESSRKSDSMGSSGDGQDPKSPRGAGHLMVDIMHRMPHVAQNVLKLDKQATTVDSKELNFRNQVRGAMEDIILAVLIRKKIKGAPFLAAFTALEIEQGLYQKYDESAQTDYQRHFRMLNTNLKRTNNENLVSSFPPLSND